MNIVGYHRLNHMKINNMTKRKLKNALYTTLVMAAFFGLIKLMTWLTENHWLLTKYIVFSVLLGTMWVVIYGMVSITNEE